MSLYKRPGSPYWWYKFNLGGKCHRGSTETENKREAGRIELREKDRTKMELLSAPTQPAGADISLERATAKYLHEEGHELADVKSVGVYLQNAIAFLGAHRQLSTIEDSDIARLVEHRKKQHIKNDPKRPLVSAATVNRSTVQALQPIFTRARKVWKIALTKEPDWASHKLEEPKERVRVLRESENNKFAEVFGPDWEVLRTFALQSALRKRATLIKWTEVDFEEGIIEVKTKRGKIARVPITPTIKSILLGRRGHHPVYVFTFVAERTTTRKIRGKTYSYIAGERYPITYSGWTSYWKRKSKESGVKNFRIHDMRHDRATRIYEATGDLAVVQKLLGHSNIATTQKYAHVSVDHVKQAMLKADKGRVA